MSGFSCYDANDRLTTETLDDDVAQADGIEQTTTDGYDHTQQTKKTVADALNSSLSTLSYSYDLQGRMSNVKTEGFTNGTLSSRDRVTYDYDATGIRIGSAVYADTVLDPVTENWTLTTSTEFLVDHRNFTGYQQTIKETTYDDQGVITKTIEYTFGHDEIAQTVTPYVNGVANTVNAETHVFGHDGHGSVRVLFDMAAAIAQVFAFDAYGQMLSIHNGAAQFVSASASAALTSLLYSGEHFDAKINQQYLRARFYDPATGRFNRLDPFAGNMQDPQSLHKYLYAHGDSIQGIDPTGRNLTSTISAIGIGLNIASLTWNSYHAFTADNARDQGSYGAWAMLDLLFLLVPFSGVVSGGGRAALAIPALIDLAIVVRQSARVRTAITAGYARNGWIAGLPVLGQFGQLTLKNAHFTFANGGSASQPFTEALAGRSYGFYNEAIPSNKIFGTLDDAGVLVYDVDNATQTGYSGFSMFNRMMDYLGTKVTAIKGVWGYGTNLDRVNELTRAGMELEEAITHTRAAGYASSRGFNNARLLEVEGTQGSYEWVKVIFE
ncbi:MAG TPA: RHS repeat-associated core domain-containing protein [Pirellulaceae bacterium]|nr:RHS repeat-associated core domain-containing protein [Pirellulaceae bacterium]